MEPLRARILSDTGDTKLAIGLATGLSLAGKGLGFLGQKKQQKANDRAYEEAQAAQNKYNDELEAWENAERQRAHGAAVAHYNEQRAAEMRVLMDKGATSQQLADHDKKMRDEFMAEADAFGIENYNSGVAENTSAAQAEGQEALDDARATREGPNTEGRSTAFKEAADAAMAKADARGDSRNESMGKLTGRTRVRQGEEVASRNMGTMGAAGARESQHLQKMGDMRRDRLGYVAPQAPVGPPDLSTRPKEPEMEIETSSSGNKLSGLGQAVGSVGSWMGGGHMGANGTWTSNSSAAKGWMGNLGNIFGK